MGLKDGKAYLDLDGWCLVRGCSAVSDAMRRYATPKKDTTATQTPTTNIEPKENPVNGRPEQCFPNCAAETPMP
jgi:hypothetical protein